MTYWLTFNLFKKKRIFRKKNGKKRKKTVFFFRQLKKPGFFKTLCLCNNLVDSSPFLYMYQQP